jgi:hypothetical protein
VKKSGYSNLVNEMGESLKSARDYRRDGLPYPWRVGGGFALGGAGALVVVQLIFIVTRAGTMAGPWIVLSLLVGPLIAGLVGGRSLGRGWRIAWAFGAGFLMLPFVLLILRMCVYGGVLPAIYLVLPAAALPTADSFDRSVLNLIAASAAAGLTLGIGVSLGLQQMNRGARFTLSGIGAFTLAGVLVTIGMFILGTPSIAGAKDATAALIALPIVGLFIGGALTGFALMRSERTSAAAGKSYFSAGSPALDHSAQEPSKSRTS